MKKENIGKVSVIVSTYNRCDALQVCLRSLFQQAVLPDEVIIGDDGSTEETAVLIKKLQKEAPFPLIHVWHEDKGYRLAMMRNKCVAKSSGNYIIEIDGDVFAHPLFVADHIKEATIGCYLKGVRVSLGRKLTEEICVEGYPRHIGFWTKGIDGRRENGIHCTWLAHLLAPRYHQKSYIRALGCNMSFFREDYIKINGYDEFFEGWGSEDRDFAARLQSYGCQKRYLKFAGIVYHLWHKRGFKYNEDRNEEYLNALDSRNFRCTNGVDKYL